MARTKRLYETWKGSNTFLLCGRLIFGPDVRSLFVTIILILVPAVTFCVFVARHFLTHYVQHRGYAVMVITIVYTSYVLVLLLLTSGRDPGIVPRNLYPPELEEDVDVASSPGEWGRGQTPRLRLPRTKDVIVNGVAVKTKYCDTCMLYRPPRCSHCSICNNCVLRFDHHCPWVGQCIGHRNYRFFFMFVGSTAILCIYVFAFCGVYIQVLMREGNHSVTSAMARSPAAVVLMVYTFISVWFVGGLTLFHLYLIGTNQTTYENFRYRYDNKVNPYNQGILQNFCEIFCTPIATSKNKFRSQVLESMPHGQKGGGPFPSRDAITNNNLDLEIERKVVNTNIGAISQDGGDENNILLRQGGQINPKRELGLTMNEFDMNRLSPEARNRPSSVAHNLYSNWRNNHSSWEITPDMLATAEGSSIRNTGNEKGSDRRQWAVTARDKARFASTQGINYLSTDNYHINIPSNNKVGRGTRDSRGKSSATDIASLKNSPIAYQPFNHSKSNVLVYPPPAKNNLNTLQHSTIKSTPPTVQEAAKALVENINSSDQVEFDIPMTQQSSLLFEMHAPEKVSSAATDAIKIKEKPVSVASQYSQYAFKGGAPPLPRDYGNTNSNGNRPFGLKRANSMRGEATSALDGVVAVPMSVDLNNVSHTRKYRFRFHSF